MYNDYQKEVLKKYENSTAYKEFLYKTKDYSNKKWDLILEELNNIFEQFSICFIDNKSFDSLETQYIVERLKNYISENLYSCSNNILLSLGKMYVNDQRFTRNIDKYVVGNAFYINQAINYYCDNN